MSKTNEEEIKKKESSSIVPKVLVGVSAGIALFAAVGLTVYNVQTKRARELNKQRFGENSDNFLLTIFQTEEDESIWSKIKTKTISFIESVKYIFGKQDTFIRTPPLVSMDQNPFSREF